MMAKISGPSSSIDPNATNANGIAVMNSLAPLASKPTKPEHHRPNWRQRTGPESLTHQSIDTGRTRLEDGGQEHESDDY